MHRRTCQSGYSKLFYRYPAAKDLAIAEISDVEMIIKSLGFFRSKAANIVNMAKQLVEHFQGEVPDELEKLITLSGVGRKTANVVLGTWFKSISGVVVDTHVKRISAIWGLTRSANPEVIEQDLIKLIPRKDWIMYSHRVIHHGRKYCKARNPQCEECPIKKLCPKIGIVKEQ